MLVQYLAKRYLHYWHFWHLPYVVCLPIIRFDFDHVFHLFFILSCPQFHSLIYFSIDQQITRFITFLQFSSTMKCWFWNFRKYSQFQNCSIWRRYWISSMSFHINCFLMLSCPLYWCSNYIMFTIEAYLTQVISKTGNLMRNYAICIENSLFLSFK